MAPGTEPLLRVGIRATPDDEAALRALSHLKDAIFIPDPERTPLIPTEMVRKLNIRSALVIPLPGEGGLLGLITVRRYFYRPPVDAEGSRCLSRLSGG